MADRPMDVKVLFVGGRSTDGPECGWLANPDQPIASDDVVTYLLNPFTDGPIVCSLGRSTNSLLTMRCGLFVEPIDRWSYACLLYTSVGAKSLLKNLFKLTPLLPTAVTSSPRKSAPSLDRLG
ncbi:hypothetical protein DEO72_LG1g3106 [Vigna unguiculata]|uniref:Uncharacterized protein n=1 Tax=Vigna unguiculata TaxID=3917 RepID=A0A4D6KZD0_VIGUN|nr:hypothetical protein DEO72_LG1g3106 [Vigna unguiculata]